MKLLRQSELEEYIDIYDDNNNRKSKGIAATVGGDQIVTKEEKGEIYIRADGKKVRRVKKTILRKKKKESTGASELQDFYRFQRKETRKRNVQDLREKFEEDLKKVKKMKEERQYKPF